MKLQRYFFCALVLMCAGGGLRAESSPSSTDVTGSLPDSDPRVIHDCISEPSETHRVSFEGGSDGTSVIKEVKVEPGDLVKKGDVLMTEDTAQAEAELAIIKAAAEATGAEEEQQATITSKDKLIDMLVKSKAYSEVELLNAQLDRDIAAARLKAAQEEAEQRKLQYVRQVVKIEHMTLHSPVDGTVERVSLFAGEAVDASSSKDGSCYIVNNNPLWIELHLDARRADRLKMHDSVEISYPFEAGAWHPGEVIYLSPELDYVGQTRTVRLSVPNPDNRPSGESVTVRLPESVMADLPPAAAADASVKP